MLRATLKSLLAHKVRLLLTAVAVILGVAFVSGTYVLSDTMTRTFDSVFLDANRGVDLVVRAETGFETNTGNGEEREVLPRALVSTLAAVPGVERAVGDVTGYAQMVAPDGKAVTTTGAPTLGVVFDEGQLGGALTVALGRAPGAGEMAMDGKTFVKHGFRLGQRVTVLTVGRPRTLTLVGTVRFGTTDSLAGATLAVFDLATAQDVLHKTGFDAITLRLAPGADRAAVRQAITRVLPPRSEVITGEEEAEEDSAAIGEILGFLTTVLLVFAAVAVFVGGFIIVNTFTILVAQRSRELALLRAMGATRGQVIRSVVLEALVVGLFASAVGLALGVVVAKGLQVAMGAFGVELPATGAVLLPRTAVVSFAVGIGVTVLASLLPARRASAVPPIAAMRDENWVAPQASLRRRALAGGALLALGVAALAAGLFGGTDSALQLVGLGAAVLFLGVTTIAPLLARRLASWLGAPFARWRGLPGRLGRENAMRNPRRTSATAAALMVGLALVGLVSVLAESVKASAGDVVDRSLGADFVISSENFFVAHTPEVARALRLHPELETVAEARSGPFQVRGNDAFLSGMDPSSIEDVMRLRLVDGDVTALRTGALLIDTEVAATLDADVGDTLEVEFGRTGPRTLSVGGVYGPNELVGPYLVSIETFDAHFAQQLNVVTLVNADPAVTADRARDVVQGVLAEYPHLVVRDSTEIKAFQRGQVNRLLGLIIVLLALAILIAFFGIVNTLALSVYERVRELGLLRAVGMSRGQVRRMIRYEAVIIAVLGAVLGLALGLLLGTALVAALQDEGITTLAIPLRLLATFLVLAGLSGVVAALLPARRAARLKVLDAIAHA